VDVEDTLIGAVYKSAEAEVVTDPAAYPRAGRLLPDVEFGPVLAVPLGTAGQVRGAFALYRAAGAPPFDAAMVKLTADMAVQGAVV